MPLAKHDQAELWERWALVLGLCFASALILLPRFDIWTGWASVDEEAVLSWVQSIREGLWPPLRLGQGYLHQLTLALGCGTFGWTALGARVTAFFIFLAECAALSALTKRWAGERPAVWAVLVNCLAAFSLTRGASLLSFSMTPLELCLLLLALPRATKHSGWALVWGALVALFAVDYEGALLAVPGLGVAFALARPKARVVLAGGAGLVLGAGLLVWGSAPYFADTLAVRRSQSLPPNAIQAWRFFVAHAQQYFMGGGRGLVYLGSPQHPAWPPWALAGLLLGLPLTWIKGSRAVWLLLLLPFVALLAHSPAIEPNRVVVAWPMLCLVAGVGLAALVGWLKARRPRLQFLILPLVLAGAVSEARAYLRGLEEHWPRFYHESASLERARIYLDSLNPRPQVLSSMRPGGGELGRFALGTPADQGQNLVLVLLPWQLSAQRDPKEGQWFDFYSVNAEAPVTLLLPAPESAKLWIAREARLNAWWRQLRALPPSQALAKLRAIDMALEDPWSRSALWDQRLRLARYLGQENVVELSQAATQSPAPADAWMRLAQGFAGIDPSKALAAVSNATRADPRRRDAWRLKLGLLRAQAQMAEAETLAKELNAHDPRETFEPSWLKD